MKSFATVVFTVLVVAMCASFSNAVVANWVKMINRPKLITCAQQNNISQQDLQNLIDNHLENDSQGMQCTVLCYFKVIGMMDDGARVDVCASKLKMSLGENPFKVNRIVDKCSKIRGYDTCNQAWLINKCYVAEGLL